MQEELKYECRCGKRFNKQQGKDSLYEHFYKKWKEGDPNGCLKYRFAKMQRQRGFKIKLDKELDEKKS